MYFYQVIISVSDALCNLEVINRKISKITNKKYNNLPLRYVCYAILIGNKLITKQI